MTQQFKKLHVSETVPGSAQKFPAFNEAVNSKNMEKSENINVNLDAAPAWLLQYLAKMKSEIKKEVIAELTSVQNEVPSGHLQKTSDMTQETESQKVVHSGIFCDNCDQQICGIRYKCGNCSDFDLCQDCESLPNIHNSNHLFLKIRHPIAFKLYQKQKSKSITDEISLNSNFLFMTSFFSAKFLCDETIPDGTVVAPSSHFIKSWRVQNVGTSAWTEAVKLRLVKSVLDANDLMSSHDEVDVPPLKPFEEGIVSVHFNAPSFPGEFKSYWNFVHENKVFGHKVWCHVVVKETMFKEKTEVSPPEVLHSPVLDISIEKDIESQRKEVASIEQVLSAVKEEHDKGNIVPRKLAVSSYTATPNNTPFDLTPPKSPDHQIPVKEIQEITGKSVTSNSKNNDSDDECSILSISSESDTEFVVVPMPKCFDIIESLMSHHLSQMQTEMKSKESNENSTTEQNTTRQNLKPLFCASEMVSQETGVPELPEHIENEIKRNAPSVVKKDKTVMFSHTATDGSSSEISIIESEDSSPVLENAIPLIDSISVAVSNENISKLDVVPEMKYPVPEIFKDEAVPKDLIVEVEENESNLGSATFPKYPVEGITSTYEPVPINQNSEERSIQVLPEGLVTGALCAAASVYNTARSVISTIQQSKNERSLSQDAPDNSHRSQASVLNPMDQLVEMGFCNRHQNEQLLKKHNGDVAQAVAELVSLNDNDWYASRHSPPSPPDLFG